MSSPIVNINNSIVNFTVGLMVSGDTSAVQVCPTPSQPVPALSLGLDGLESLAKVCPRLSQQSRSAVSPTNNGLKMLANQSPKSSAQSQSKDAFWSTPPMLPSGNHSLNQLISLSLSMLPLLGQLRYAYTVDTLLFSFERPQDSS